MICEDVLGALRKGRSPLVLTERTEHLKALAQKGKTILIITHDYEFAAMTCNRVLHFIDEGHAETFPLQGSLPRLYSCLMCQ